MAIVFLFSKNVQNIYGHLKKLAGNTGGISPRDPAENRRLNVTVRDYKVLVELAYNFPAALRYTQY